MKLYNLYYLKYKNLFHNKMGGKKKGGDGKKKAGKAAVDENDNQVADVWKLYRKAVVEYDVEISK